ncbi:MAG: MBL fold metallo-hydrolase [Thermaerobacterales bacterium]
MSPEDEPLQLYGRPLGPLQANCYILARESRCEALVIDPGADDPWLEETLKGYTLTHIVLTHAHYDHIGGLNSLRANTGAPVLIHEAEQEWLADPALNLSVMGGEASAVVCDGPDQLLAAGDEISFAGHSLRVLHTPGHSPGGITLLVADICLSGDTLFYRSIGRTDLPGGDHGRLLRVMRRELLVLPDEVQVFPGHGPMTTIGDERKFNPFIN